MKGTQQEPALDVGAHVDQSGVTSCGYYHGVDELRID